jgi:predicted peptidase
MKAETYRLLVLVGIAAALSTSAAAQSNGSAGSSAPAHIKSVTAITEVFGDGQKIVAAAVEYDALLDSARLLTSTFAVADRTITKVYANASAARAARGVNGRYAIIELSTADDAAAIIPAMGGRGGPSGPGGPGGPGGQAGARAQGGQAQGPGGQRGGMGGLKRRPVKVSVTQSGELTTAAGTKYPAVAAAVESDRAINLIVDDFKPFVFKDAESGKTLMYNLFVPRDYDSKKSYPLVLFMHDASVVSSEPDRTLVQGLGAVIWASPEEQAKHPAFVLAPQEDPETGSDPTKTADLYVRLVASVVGQYSIDKKRLYTTGQSAGCMRSIAMDIKYPDLFAASLLVAGQGDAQEMLAMIHEKLWVIVSEGDFRAFPGMNASVEAWEKAGAKVTKGRWSAREPQEVQAANVARMIAERNTIMYTTYVKGTCLPPEQANSGAQEHMASWQFAYAIPAVRNWLFAQSK